MNSKDKGNTTEAMVLAELVRAGRRVLVPWGDNLRYDLAYDDGGKLVRVQCKTAHVIGGAIEFSVCSSQRHRGKGSQTYKGQADIFGVYCPELRSVYFVPVAECPNTSCRLRVKPAKNNQVKRMKYAGDYQV